MRDTNKSGVCCGALGSDTALQAWRSWVQFPMCSLRFFIRTVGCNGKEYQGFKLQVNGFRMKNLTSSFADCLEILEPPTPAAIRVCPGLCRDSFTSFFPVVLKPSWYLQGHRKVNRILRSRIFQNISLKFYCGYSQKGVKVFINRC